MGKGTFIGIDFGTTNTSVVQIISDEYGKKILHLGEEGEYPFSSIVAVPKKNGTMLFGREVKRRRLELSGEYDIIYSMKSYLGMDEEFIFGNKRYTPTDITAAFLKHIKDYIKTDHNIDIEEATFAIPIDFTPEARRELNRAAKAANIDINGFVSEPTAAYIANKNDAKAYSKIMVIDWGGGTIDISVLDLKGTGIYENSIHGAKIGGDDIDIELAYRIHSKLVNQTGINLNLDEMDSAQKDNIISRCENLKIEFSDYYDTNDILLRNYGEFGTKSLSIDYDYFEEIVSPIIKNKVLKAIHTAMEQANTSKAGLDAIILVGGSCGLKPFSNIIINLFGIDKIIAPEKPQWSVAIGAALVDIIGDNYYLNDDVGVLLSNDNVYTIFKKGEDKIGSAISSIVFSLTEDAPNAHFIFTNSEKTIDYGSVNVQTKGFLKEKLILSAFIEKDHIATIKIANPFKGNEYFKKMDINKLKFYYDLSEVDDI